MVYSFGGSSSDGANPAAGLINVDGTLYSITVRGGTGACFGDAGICGTVFSVTPAGAETVVYSFKGGSDGAGPVSGLIDVNGTLYGTTVYGGGTGGAGGFGYGTVFALTRSGKETVVYSFNGGTDGAYPQAGLINVGGVLYGTTVYGGGTGCPDNYGCGTVFSVMPVGIETVLHSFGDGAGGAGPYAGLMNVRGTLYGTTRYGGDSTYGHGTVFSLTLGGPETVVYSFKGGHGAYPEAGLVNLGGTFYGTTTRGGAYHLGTVFNLKP